MSNNLQDYQSLKDYIDSIRPKAIKLGVKIKAWETIESHRKEFLKQIPQNSDVLIFGYGSLMWNPQLKYSSKSKVRLIGYHRKFCLDMYLFRGSKTLPGVMMALDKGAHCDGLAFKITNKNIDKETQKLWAREFALGGYTPILTYIKVDHEIHPLPCITFVMNVHSNRYNSNLTIGEIAHRISTAKGDLGSNLEYFENTHQELTKLYIKDEQFEAIAQKINFIKEK